MACYTYKMSYCVSDVGGRGSGHEHDLDLIDSTRAVPLHAHILLLSLVCTDNAICSQYTCIIIVMMTQPLPIASKLPIKTLVAS